MPICNNSGYTKSIWMDVEFPSFPELANDEAAEVCIVGTGIAGLTCAYNLIKQGKSVVVIDQGMIAGGQTARTTAHLSWVLGTRYTDFEKTFGLEKAQTIAQSHSSAIDFIEKVINEEKIDCDFERTDGYLFTPDNNHDGILDKELAICQKMGMKVNKIEKAPLDKAFDTGECLHFPNQAKFHVLKYLKALIAIIIAKGGKVYTNAQACEFDEGHGCTVKTTSGHTITSQFLIIATCTPINNRFIIHTKQSAYRTYVIAAPVAKNALKSLYWDTADPYHYVRTQHRDENSDWLIIGGEDHKTGQERDDGSQYTHLESWGRERFPMLGKIEDTWSGQVFETVDGIAFIGLNPEDKKTYIATGDCGNGITHGTIAGMLLPDLILNKTNPWGDLYDPSRVSFSEVKEYIEENLNSIGQYADYFSPGDNVKVAALNPGEGILLGEGISKVAIYKDKDLKIHRLSPVCTHLGGCVQWNEGEKSWDCPVHGARFDGCGRVLNGPACQDLKKLNQEKINLDQD